VEERFDALGLEPIGYGQTSYDEVRVPESHLVLRRGQSGLRMIYDTLFRSRLGMPAIAAGFCRRLYDEAAERASARRTFGLAINTYDQVQYRLSALRGMAELNRRLWGFTARWMDANQDISGDYVLVNASKVVCSETMQSAADSSVQLFASAAYKRNHLVGRGYVDCRPFLIFEGSNDVLHDNTFETMVARHGSCTLTTLSRELAAYGLSLSAEIPEAGLRLFECSERPSQRQRVQLGRVIAWFFMLGIVEGGGDVDSAPGRDAVRVAQRAIAALAGEMAYL